MSRQNNTVAPLAPCPRCTGPMDRVLMRNALSLKDSKTYVCLACRMAESFCGQNHQDPWPSFPEPMSRRV